MIANWASGAIMIERVVEEAWRERWIKERERRAAVRLADDFDY